MEITEVRVKLMEDTDDRLQAFCSITFDDCFVVRDLKIIDGTNGPFVAMPSRKLTFHCPQCGSKNHLRSAYCNQCGLRMKDDRAIRDQESRSKLYADIAHPINSDCREMIQSRVIAEFEAELERSEQPGYASRYDDDYDDAAEDFGEEQSDRGEETGTSEQTDNGEPTRHQPSIENAQIEPGESSPRGPHRAPSKERADQTQSAPKSRPDKDFGAGIF